MTLMDKSDDFQTHSYSFAGIADVILRFAEQVSGATGIPLVRLFGQSPSVSVLVMATWKTTTAALTRCRNVDYADISAGCLISPGGLCLVPDCLTISRLNLTNCGNVGCRPRYDG
jgi:hypothetical protein